MITNLNCESIRNKKIEAQNQGLVQAWTPYLELFTDTLN